MAQKTVRVPAKPEHAGATSGSAGGASSNSFADRVWEEAESDDDNWFDMTDASRQFPSFAGQVSSEPVAAALACSGIGSMLEPLVTVVTKCGPKNKLLGKEGVLLVVVGRTADDTIIPLIIAFAESESLQSWWWVLSEFLNAFRDSRIVELLTFSRQGPRGAGMPGSQPLSPQRLAAGSPCIPTAASSSTLSGSTAWLPQAMSDDAPAIFTDRNPVLKTAVSILFPGAFHVVCSVHLKVRISLVLLL